MADTASASLVSNEIRIRSVVPVCVPAVKLGRRVRDKQTRMKRRSFCTREPLKDEYGAEGSSVPGIAVAREFPCFCVFPGNVHGMIQVQQQAFAAVQEAQADHVVVEEGRQWSHHNVGDAES